MKTAAFALLLLAPLMAAPAHAAERGYSVTDFDRIRIDGPYRVTLTTGRSPGARAVGAQAAIEGVAVEVQGPHADRPAQHADLGRLSPARPRDPWRSASPATRCAPRRSTVPGRSPSTR
jgi:hypothetical protein